MELSINDSFLTIGKNYLFRTVTMIYTGKLEKENQESFLLSSACWIADTGRFADNLISCEFNEVEPYKNPTILFKCGILDVTEIERLPKEQK